MISVALSKLQVTYKLMKFNSLIQSTNLIKNSLYNEKKDINDPNLQGFFIFSQQ